MIKKDMEMSLSTIRALLWEPIGVCDLLCVDLAWKNNVFCHLTCHLSSLVICVNHIITGPEDSLVQYSKMRMTGAPDAKY